MSGKYLTGKQFMTGNHALAEGAIMAGCRFFAGYPITPASPIAERMSWRLPEVGGHYIQMEDEIGIMAAIIGGSVGGVKSMTATSGPGLSLMLENIGLAYMMETPVVIVNIMRGGPSTGMPTLTSQGDIMQSRWGSHGDYNMIAYAPSTVQEMFDFAIKAFNASEKLRTPVMVLGDQVIGLMTSDLVIPNIEDIEIVNRKIPPEGLEDYKPYDSRELIPPMAIAGQGYHVHMTGLTHNELGYPDVSVSAQEKLIKRLNKKFETYKNEIIEIEEFMMDDAKIAVACYGSESRSVINAVKRARKEGIKVGMYRFKTLWPFPDEQVRELSNRVEKIIVSEVNMGQYFHPIREHAECEVVSLPHSGGTIHHPNEILQKIKKEVK